MVIVKKKSARETMAHQRYLSVKGGSQKRIRINKMMFKQRSGSKPSH